MAENQNFKVTVNDASESIVIEDKPDAIVPVPTKKNDKGGVNDATAQS
jgi:hypothetical protein